MSKRPERVFCECKGNTFYLFCQINTQKKWHGGVSKQKNQGVALGYVVLGLQPVLLYSDEEVVFLAALGYDVLAGDEVV